MGRAGATGGLERRLCLACATEAIAVQPAVRDLLDCNSVSSETRVAAEAGGRGGVPRMGCEVLQWTEVAVALVLHLQIASDA